MTWTDYGRFSATASSLRPTRIGGTYGRRRNCCGNALEARSLDGRRRVLGHVRFILRHGRLPDMGPHRARGSHLPQTASNHRGFAALQLSQVEACLLTRRLGKLAQIVEGRPSPVDRLIRARGSRPSSACGGTRRRGGTCPSCGEREQNCWAHMKSESRRDVRMPEERIRRRDPDTGV